MSGGHFDYDQYKIGYIAESIRSLIDKNDLEEYPYSNKTIIKFNEAICILKRAEVYVQRVDWLVSGDDGEETFHKRLKEDLSKL